MKTDNSSFERVEEFKYLEITLTHQNFIQEEIKSRVKSGNVCCRLVQNLWLPLLSKNLKIKIYRTIISPLLCMGVKLCRTSREECRLRMFENRVLMGLFGPKRDE